MCSEMEFTVTKSDTSGQIPTVGVVEWSLAGAAPSSAKILFKLKDAPSSILNRGGEAPVDLGKPTLRALRPGRPCNRGSRRGRLARATRSGLRRASEHGEQSPCRSIASPFRMDTAHSCL